MKWRAPSERVQFILALPVIVPAMVLLVPFGLLMVAQSWLLEKIAPSQDWHRWFAWRPVPLGHWADRVGQRSEWAWLQVVERRGRPYGWETEYRVAARGAK